MHRAILDYLYSASLIKTYEQLRQEAPGFVRNSLFFCCPAIKSVLGQNDFQADPGAKSSGLLVKKWMSVIRMQKKVHNCVADTNHSALFHQFTLADHGVGD